MFFVYKTTPFRDSWDTRKSRSHYTCKLRIGQRVYSKWKMYPGRVDAVNHDDDTLMIEFDDGIIHKVNAALCKSLNYQEIWSASCNDSTMHTNDSEVAIYPVETDGTKKTAMLSKLQNLGNHVHNCAVLRRGEGNLLVSYRPSTHASVHSYTTCEYCYEYYAKYELWRHNLGPRVLSKSRIMLPILPGANDALAEVLATMRSDDVSRVCKSDTLILQLARKETFRLGHEKDAHSYIRSKMRKLGRLLICLKTRTGIYRERKCFRMLSCDDYDTADAFSTLCEMKSTEEVYGETIGTVIPAGLRLNKITLAWIILFNRRRPGEVSRIEASQYGKRHSAALGEIGDMLSTKEQGLCKLFTCLEIKGKRGSTVPVLLTTKVQVSLDLLFQNRAIAGVEPKNVYLFARSNYGSMGHIREHIWSTKLHKHVATMSQILNLQEQEMDLLAQFMGHDIRVHRQYYRPSEGTLQVAKLSKLFLAIENGTLTNNAGKRLEYIDIQPDEEIQHDGNGTGSDNELDDNKYHPLERDVDNTKVAVPIGPYIAKRTAAIMKHLGKLISRKTLLGKNEINNCLRTEPALRLRNWRNVKDFCRNKMQSLH
ncbi:hypothetical protein ACJMK2_026150 [Sinanodonta woodiana]|uniref:Uncharacterized protein n=1 Tax=Sinanodonta woodiana TaxID=1069815 RepID=A0ABD3XIP7_SINWO